MGCTLFRTHLLKGLDFCDIKIDSQDGYATCLFFKLNQVKVVMADEVIFGYRRHNSNVSSNLVRLRQNRQRILDYFYSRIPSTERKLFDLVPIDTDIEDLFDSDGKFLKNYGYISVRDGFAVINNRSIKIPKDETLIEFFKQLKEDGNFVFINVKKLGSSYSEGLLASFVQYVL